MTITGHFSGTVDSDALDVLDILDRWDNRFNGRADHNRQHIRKKYRTKVMLHITGDHEPTSREEIESECVEVWARNLSQGGINFILPTAIRGNDVVIGVAAESTLWMKGQIVRSRQVHNRFWEYGVKFTGRLEF